jgi:hypothetical protein
VGNALGTVVPEEGYAPTDMVFVRPGHAVCYTIALYRGVHQGTTKNTYIPLFSEYYPVNNEVAVGSPVRFSFELTLRILL